MFLMIALNSGYFKNSLCSKHLSYLSLVILDILSNLVTEIFIMFDFTGTTKGSVGGSSMQNCDKKSSVVWKSSVSSTGNSNPRLFFRFECSRVAHGHFVDR